MCHLSLLTTKKAKGLTGNIKVLTLNGMDKYGGQIERKLNEKTLHLLSTKTTKQIKSSHTIDV